MVRNDSVMNIQKLTASVVARKSVSAALEAKLVAALTIKGRWADPIWITSRCIVDKL